MNINIYYLPQCHLLSPPSHNNDNTFHSNDNASHTNFHNIRTVSNSWHICGSDSRASKETTGVPLCIVGVWGEYAPNGSVTNGYVMTVAGVMSLFKDLMPSLEEVYYGNQVNDACASAIVDALWVLACTLDTLIEQSRSVIYHSRQAVGVVCDALFCVQPKEEDSDGEDSDGEESEAGPLQRIPAQPYDYLGDVLNALTAIQKQGQ